MVNNKFIALANLQPVHCMQSGWLMVWLTPEWRRKRLWHSDVEQIWSGLYKLCFVGLGFRTLVAITQQRNIQRLATKFGGRKGDVIRNLYGTKQHGYVAIWETTE
jgi:hypothetical protein